MEATIAILQARTSSSRLPGKVLAPILGCPMILRQIARLRRAAASSHLVVATSRDSSDDELADVLLRDGVAVYRGELDDVLGRFIGALDAVAPHAGTVVRLTGDCPLCDPDIVDAMISYHHETGADYTSNTRRVSFPNGLDVEVVQAKALRAAAAEATLVSEREHVLPFIWTRPDRFRLAQLVAREDRSALRWTVDTPNDLAFVRAIYAALYPMDPEFGTDAILSLLERDPDLSLINGGQVRNEGYARSLREDRLWDGSTPTPRAASVQGDDT